MVGAANMLKPGWHSIRLEHLCRLEAAALGDHVVGALGDEGQRVEARAVGERARRGARSLRAVIRFKIGEVAQRHHQQVAMRRWWRPWAGRWCRWCRRARRGRPDPAAAGSSASSWPSMACQSSSEPATSGGASPGTSCAHAFDPFRVAFVGDAEPGARVAQDVFDLARVQLGVDGDRDEAGVPDAEERFEIVRPVRHDDGRPGRRARARGGARSAPAMAPAR